MGQGLLRKFHPPQEVLEAGVGAEGVANSNIKTGPVLGGQVKAGGRCSSEKCGRSVFYYICHFRPTILAGVN